MVTGISNTWSPYDNTDYTLSYSQKKEKEENSKTESSEECKTCESRKYQDSSNENVSFKSPTHISSSGVASAVRSHEGEHVSNAYEKASQNNGKVIRASVSIHTSVCPECGDTYVSGGTTNSVIKYSNKTSQYQEDKKAQAAFSNIGQNLDYAV